MDIGKISALAKTSPGLTCISTRRSIIAILGGWLIRITENSGIRPKRSISKNWSKFNFWAFFEEFEGHGDDWEWPWSCWSIWRGLDLTLNSDFLNFWFWLFFRFLVKFVKDLDPRWEEYVKLQKQKKLDREKDRLAELERKKKEKELRKQRAREAELERYKELDRLRGEEVDDPVSHLKHPKSPPKLSKTHKIQKFKISKKFKFLLKF